MNRNRPIKKLVKKARSAAVLAKELEFVTKERDKLQRDFDSFKAVHDVLVDDARKGIGLSGVISTGEMKNSVKKTWSARALLQELQTVTRQRDELEREFHEFRNSRSEKASFQDGRGRVVEDQLHDLEKAHAELQKFYAQSQDELHACRERELMRPWWKKLLGIH